MDVAQEILTIIARYKELPVEEVAPGKKFEQIGIDSLDAIDIIYELEDRFQIEIPTDQIDLQPDSTVGDLLALIETHLAGAAGPDREGAN